MKTITYIDYNETYHNDLNYLMNFQWGEGSDSDDIINHINDYIVKLALSNNKVIGCAIYHQEKDSIYLDMTVILPDFQRMGIGSAFMKQAFEYAIDHKINRIETSAIEAKNHTNGKKILENFGFKETKTIPNYWGKLCPDFKCKECGNCPCTCTLHYYVKEIGELF